jgi:hypothetical protein
VTIYVSWKKEVSLHPSQILKDSRGMQAVVAEFPGCAENSTAFWREELKHFASIHLFPGQHHIPSQPGSAKDWSPPGYGAGLFSSQ